MKTRYRTRKPTIISIRHFRRAVFPTSDQGFPTSRLHTCQKNNMFRTTTFRIIYCTSGVLYTRKTGRIRFRLENRSSWHPVACHVFLQDLLEFVGREPTLSIILDMIHRADSINIINPTIRFSFDGCYINSYFFPCLFFALVIAERIVFRKLETHSGLYQFIMRNIVFLYLIYKMENSFRSCLKKILI